MMQIQGTESLFQLQDTVILLQAKLAAAQETIANLQDAHALIYRTCKELGETIRQRDEVILGQQAHIYSLRECNAKHSPRCRDCADEAGVCPSSGLPCDRDNNLAALYENNARVLEKAANENSPTSVCSDVLNNLRFRAAEYRAKG